MKAEQAKSILKKYDRRLLKQTKDCVGTAAVYKKDKWVLQVFLQKKRPSHNHLTTLRLGEKPKIKKVGEQTPENELSVELLVTGMLKPFADHTAKYRPCPGGVSIGHYNITAGTFGCVVYKEREAPAVGYDRFVLSNNHVLADCNDAEIGDDIYQPGPYDGGTSEDKIGELEDYITLLFNNPDGPYNLVDAAICKPTDENDIADSFLDQKGTNSVQREASIWEPVIKIGRTTGSQTGFVVGFTGVIAVYYGSPGLAYFDDQIVTNYIGQPGDSGSLLMDKCGKRALGLLFAGSSFEGTIIYNKAEYIESLLDVAFAPKKRVAIENTSRDLEIQIVGPNKKICDRCCCPEGPYDEQEWPSKPPCEDDECCEDILDLLDAGTLLGFLVTVSNSYGQPGEIAYCEAIEGNWQYGDGSNDGNWLVTEGLDPENAPCALVGEGYGEGPTAGITFCNVNIYSEPCRYFTVVGIAWVPDLDWCHACYPYTSPEDWACHRSGNCSRFIHICHGSVSLSYRPIYESTILPDIELHVRNGGGTLKERIKKIKETRRKQGKIMIPSKKIVKPNYPSLMIMARTFSKAVVNHVKSGFKKRSEAEKQKVIKICKACEFYVNESMVGPRCIKCGCCMSLKKRWATSHCKLGKW